MKVCFAAHTIILTAAEEASASTFGSAEYRNLQEARRDYPDFKVVTEKKARGKKNAFSKINMDFIKRYVEKHGSDEQKGILKKLTSKSVDFETGEYSEPTSFFEVKKWFLAEFPELKRSVIDHQKQVKDIMDAAEEKAAAAKAAA